MARITLRQQIRDLSEALLSRELELTTKQARWEGERRVLEDRLTDARQEIRHEQLMRMAAQNGLTPYVYAIQGFNKWLAERPELTTQVEEILRALGLWGVEVGYDPQKDLALSIISPSRFNGRRA